LPRFQLHHDHLHHPVEVRREQLILHPGMPGANSSPLVLEDDLPVILQILKQAKTGVSSAMAMFRRAWMEGEDWSFPT